MSSIRTFTAIGLLSLSLGAHASDAAWYLKPSFGFSSLSDTTGTRIAGTTQAIEVSADSGISTGIALGYRVNDRLSGELAWEYRRNDTSTQYADGTFFPEGDYASNVIFLNGVWKFDRAGRWQPYLGAGLGFVQEIDLDLELAGAEQSFSESGDFGFQVFGGIDYSLGEQWKIGAEVRYTNMGTIDLPAEANTTGRIDGLDYDPLTVGLSMTYSF